MSPDPIYDLLCPMPECGEVVVLDWTHNTALSPEDLDRIEVDGFQPGEAHCHTWKVGCTAGHVLLIPGRPGCPCVDDQAGPSCPHNDDDYDWSDESREFRRHDLDRLRAVFAVLRGGAS